MKHGKPPPAKIATSVSPRQRTKPPEVRRQELLDAALRLFVARGVAATRVEEIVAAADVAKGTFYLHFQSKEQLLVALRQRFVDSFCAQLQAGMNRRRPEDWPGRLRAWVEAGLRGYLDSVELHDVVFHEFRPEHGRPMHDNPVVVQLAEFLDRGTRAGAWSAQNPRLNAIMLFHALHGAVDDAIAQKSAVNRDSLADMLEAIFRRVVGLSRS
jgi:AcrR family transcriptional regulator